jgi:hypothetical protein
MRFGRGGVHEMDNALSVGDAQAGVCDVDSRFASRYANDVAGSQMRFGVGDFIERNELQ